MNALQKPLRQLRLVGLLLLVVWVLELSGIHLAALLESPVILAVGTLSAFLLWLFCLVACGTGMMEAIKFRHYGIVAGYVLAAAAIVSTMVFFFSSLSVGGAIL